MFTTVSVELTTFNIRFVNYLETVQPAIKMGSCSSCHNSFFLRKSIEFNLTVIQVNELDAYRANLRLSWHDVDRLHSSFNMLDLDHDGKITLWEFLAIVGESSSNISLSVFRLFDMDHDTKIDFLEFFSATVKTCSADHDMLCRFGKNISYYIDRNYLIIYVTSFSFPDHRS